MKKFLLIILIMTASTIMVHSAEMEMGDFPLGKWLDSNWGAVWEFESNNIRILDTDGGVYCDFDKKTIENWSVKPGTKGISEIIGLVSLRNPTASDSSDSSLI